METRSAFCSACDRNVPVLVRRGARDPRDPSTGDVVEAVTCLDYGVRCTGTLCPLFEFPHRDAKGRPRRARTRGRT